MNTILKNILEIKKDLVERRKRAVPLERLLARCPRRKPLSLRASLARRGFGIIAEVKKAGPSAGLLRSRYSPGRIAAAYERAGAAGISVLTCEPYFLGKPEHLDKVRRAVALPVLWKDFIFDEYQLAEARSHGADAALLIAALLSGEQLRILADACDRFGLEAVVEVHDCADIKKAGAIKKWNNKIMGINNRNLATLQTDRARTFSLLKYIPDDTIMVISESGIRDARDIQRLKNAGVKGALVGETLLKAKYPGAKLRELIPAE